MSVNFTKHAHMSTNFNGIFFFLRKYEKTILVGTKMTCLIKVNANFEDVMKGNMRMKFCLEFIRIDLHRNDFA